MDGTGAGVAWFPCLQIVDPGGNVMSESIAASSVAAGASADVTWFPHIAAVAAAGGSGIQYDTHNVGDWLEVEATSEGGDNNVAFDLNASGGGGFFQTDGSSGAEGSSTNGFQWNEWGTGGYSFVDHNPGTTGGFFFREQGNGGFFFADNGSGGFTIQDVGGGGVLVQSENSGGIRLLAQGTTGTVDIEGQDGITVGTLPTSDPHVVGQLWNSSGVVMVSAG